MGVQIKVSAKGQVVIPAATRKRLGLVTGRVLDVVDTTDGVLLKPARAGRGLSVDEAVEAFRRIGAYDGPAATVEQMNEAVRRVRGQRARRPNAGG